jgi:hypothetical protein
MRNQSGGDGLLSHHPVQSKLIVFVVESTLISPAESMDHGVLE